MAWWHALHATRYSQLSRQAPLLQALSRARGGPPHRSALALTALHASHAVPSLQLLCASCLPPLQVLDLSPPSLSKEEGEGLVLDAAAVAVLASLCDLRLLFALDRPATVRSL